MNATSSFQEIASEPSIVLEPQAAELSESGHWSETQVIQSIKDANFGRKCPNRVLNGQSTQQLGGNSVVSNGPMAGRLITPKQRKRTRIKRFLSYLSS